MYRRGMQGLSRSLYGGCSSFDAGCGCCVLIGRDVLQLMAALIAVDVDKNMSLAICSSPMLSYAINFAAWWCETLLHFHLQA